VEEIPLLSRTNPGPGPDYSNTNFYGPTHIRGTFH